MGAGEYEKACALFEESNRQDFALGTLLYLADCYEKVGRTATAWATFKLAASESRKSNQAKREALARRYANALVPRLMRLSVGVLAENRVEGLEVTRDGVAVGAASFGVAVPVDPGKHLIEARAPGYQPWSTEVELDEPGKTLSVEVPGLALSPEEKEHAEPTEALVTPATIPPPSDASRASGEFPWRTAGLVTASVGVVSAALGSYLLVDSEAHEKDADAFCFASDLSRCDEAGIELLETADTELLWGRLTLGFGVAAVLGGALLLRKHLSTPEAAIKGSTRLRQRSVKVRAGRSCLGWMAL